MEWKECLIWEDLESAEWEVGEHCSRTLTKVANIYLLKALPLGMGNIDEFKGNTVSGINEGIGTGVGVKYLIGASELCFKPASI